MEDTETLVSLSNEEWEHIQNSLRSDIQNFYDDPCGCLCFGHGEDAEERMKMTEQEVKKLNTLCEKFGLDVKEVMEEEGVTDNEIERVVLLIRKGIMT